MQGAADLAFGALAVPFDGLLDSPGIDGQSGVELVFIGRDADEILGDEFARGDASFSSAVRISEMDASLTVKGVVALWAAREIANNKPRKVRAMDVKE